MPSIKTNKQLLSLPLNIGLLILCLLLLLFDGIGFFNPIKSVAHSIGVNITNDSSRTIDSVFKTTDVFKDRKETLEKVEQLEEENLILRSENTKLYTNLKELEIIKEQNTFTNQAETIPATVTSYIPDKFGHVLINKGSMDNVKVGDALIIKNFLLGEIVEVNRINSIARLINSPDTIISAISMENNAKGVIKGDFSIGLVMNEIPRGSTINVGESVITSSENEILQKGLVVGEVVEVNDNDSLTTKSAVLKIIPDLKNLDEVFILSIERNVE
ncbi:MAG TPA: rod shape-determining protein MreC [Candidatus Dojkabacteria bacterium]|nr:rod shape-determining protein MreC [Candidatus Dojkabacteria bacterium]HRO65415.1 rod shape-determining protein MreC [Candidatus Dojkabacteria bacterium]HRP51557.1 rod shape-determining protein MreC [Candidatus Dojkabacteria bacterium]